MKKFVLAAGAAAALIGGALLVTPASATVAVSAPAAATVTPSTSPTPKVYPPVVLSTTKRGLCVKVGTGAYANLWYDKNTGKCPEYSEGNRYWTPTTLVEAFGPIAEITGAVGPQGPKGDAGEGVVVKKGTLALTSANTSGTLTVSGLPAFATGVIEYAGNNAEARPVGSTVTITPVAAAAGSTDRKFTVAATGLGSNSFTLSVTVISVP
jgi:hypothetical protein